MTVDYFLIEGPRAVPAEFAAWKESLARWHVLADQIFSLESRTLDEFAELNRRAAEAKAEADRLKEKARKAFSEWMRA